MPFKSSAERRHHIPKQRHRATNGAAYDAALRQRGSLPVWFTDAAIAASKAEPRTSRGGRAALFEPGDRHGVDAAVRVPLGLPPNRGTGSELLQPRADPCDTVIPYATILSIGADMCLEF